MSTPFGLSFSDLAFLLLHKLTCNTSDDFLASADRPRCLVGLPRKSAAGHQLNVMTTTYKQHVYDREVYYEQTAQGTLLLRNRDFKHLLVRIEQFISFILYRVKLIVEAFAIVQPQSNREGRKADGRGLTCRADDIERCPTNPMTDIQPCSSSSTSGLLLLVGNDSCPPRLQLIPFREDERYQCSHSLNGERWSRDTSLAFMHSTLGGEHSASD